MGRFRFALQPLLDERVREEERAYTALLRARQVHHRLRDAARAPESLSCEGSSLILLSAWDRGEAVRRRNMRASREAEQGAEAAFLRARRNRMQLTILRERAYGVFLEEEECRVSGELDDINHRYGRVAG